jgi:glycosyltransferase involved in cell wall biosynthesis
LKTASPTVSVIIPCFNAASWLGEAIESSLSQTHKPLEVIVVDDGSTDSSVKVIRSFGDVVRWETGPNVGGNHARNRGFVLSKGAYIQFLDADDYLLPTKIAAQVEFLTKTGGDAVYGDWQHQHHRPNGVIEIGDIAVAGDQDDILESLLGEWWVAPVATLFRRQAINKIAGWDESLRAAQDRDFMISLAMAGARILYQSGCHSIYRRYGKVTVSTSNVLLWTRDHCRVLDKAAVALAIKGGPNVKYARTLAKSYFSLARTVFDLDRKMYADLMLRTISFDPKFSPHPSKSYVAIQRLFGFYVAEMAASLRRRLAKGEIF